MRALLPIALVLPLFLSAAQANTPSYTSEASVAYMVDLSSGRVLFDKDADRRMPPASMAKMMTAHVAFNLIKQGKLRLDQKFTVRPETWRKWHSQGSTMFLSVNEEVSVENLLHGIVTLSGNDACVVLAEGIAGSEEAFTDLMNAEAKRLGMTNSHFANTTGWPDEGRTYTTARDLATLARNTLEETPDLYKQFYTVKSFTWGQTMGGSEISQANRNPILGRVDGADGLKTGHTEEAGYGFTGSAQQNGRRLVMVVAGLTSFNGRVEESVRFMDWGFKAWRSKPLAKKGVTLGQAQVQGGWARSVDLVTPRDLVATVPIAAANGEIKARVVYRGPIKAPIAQGQEIAQLVVDAGDGTTQTLPLVAKEAVAEGGFFARLWNGFLSFFS
ncbi:MULTISPECIES: D-alanyl-D-alanine carboxypeptidase family protein [Sphingobium]|uniref:D-alanyl-D-alanine carboxypeptidase family protein n=1 Tax=Sphingobium TaxID=165695 RepID=UPI0015EC3861|nr:MULTISPECIES: D-alanyl-D-alanine carboxypeptidase family protein [Sphingobium]MCW2361671.1 D-alanyl-D-alanine carboxypeptidase (penicillin-binding protein 5/6) [Sphingobium sp. B10D3B]MCW2366534.1 D-alanyl-D-alanine carboxypeptidase (penicillin-binding protein 5/6) [Sphingobium sp. B7D2B]MCW2381936.1 D-alanyl-D-alanine carboxypeptidase (penicillin-binding protein 5/6) [Sphingobium sp. B2D3B]MCW2387871.1 D-alanyl-D-alanine carboxypeptidase (penicillin-binding protein 5/6) [Sphingobium sp. B11